MPSGFPKNCSGLMLTKLANYRLFCIVGQTGWGNRDNNMIIILAWQRCSQCPKPGGVRAFCVSSALQNREFKIVNSSKNYIVHGVKKKMIA